MAPTEEQMTAIQHICNGKDVVVWMWLYGCGCTLFVSLGILSSTNSRCVW